MDEQQIFNIVSKCKHLKYKFSGIYAADNFPVDFSKNTFIIVNTSNSDSVGEHWILLAKQNSDEAICYADPFGFPTETYKNLYKRIKYYACVNVMTHQLQSINSELCGLYCIYIAHFIFNNKYNHIPIVNDLEVFKFVKHML